VGFAQLPLLGGPARPGRGGGRLAGDGREILGSLVDRRPRRRGACRKEDDVVLKLDP